MKAQKENIRSWGSGDKKFIVGKKDFVYLSSDSVIVLTKRAISGIIIDGSKIYIQKWALPIASFFLRGPVSQHDFTIYEIAPGMSDYLLN